jgi:hypothetical protein
MNKFRLLTQIFIVSLLALGGKTYAQTTITTDDVSFSTSTGTISSYTGTATNIIIPDSFTVDGVEYAINIISSYAFFNKEISAVILPDNLQEIEDLAFYYNNLTEIVIPEGCEVGSSCFGYNSISSFTFPASMTEIPSGCFSYNSFTELTIPSTVTSIGSNAFAHNDIATLNLNEGLEEIGTSVFYLNNLTSVSIPSSVVLVDEKAFSRNDITEVTVENSVVLGGGAFTNNEIVTVNGESSDGLFYKRNGDGTIDYTTLTSYGGTESVITLSDDITVIDNYAFWQCGLTSIEVSDALTYIGSSAFYQTGLNSINIPSSLKYIGSQAFRSCDLTSFTFPKSIEYIGSEAFSYGDLTSVTFESESNIQYISAHAFSYQDDLDYTIILPTSGIDGFINYYDNEGNIYSPGSEFDNGQGCFARYSETLTLDDIVFDETTGTITDYTGSATDIIIPESFIVDGVTVAVTTIGESAFYDNDLFSVEMANSITTIEASAFKSNSSMESVTLSTGLTTIGDDAFAGSVPDDGIALPNTGTWHTSYYYTVGTEVTEITSSSAYKYHHLVYTVSFVDYDTTILEEDVVVYGTSASAPNDPTRTGYTFANWDVTFDNITANTTVTAVYTINSYTVRFEDYDGTLLESQSVNYGSDAIAPDDPTRTGYTFSAWDIDFENITEDITVTAAYSINSYTVRFEDYDGTLLKSESVNYGSAATAPSSSSHTGYTFTGWDVDFDYITANTTVTALYTINSYTVRFVDYDGTLLESQSVNYGSDAIAPDDPTRTGYTFTGWDIAFDNITEDITVTALYDVSTAIEDKNATQFIVYPNPVVNTLYVNIENTQEGIEHQISIYNILGQLVYSNSGYGTNNTISVGDWTKGVYYITVDNNKGTKFIKL